MVLLPYASKTGDPVYLGDEAEGYPPMLYPNLTYIDGVQNVSKVMYENRTLFYDTVLILGPLYLSSNSSLISITCAINNNTSRSDILGWLTVVMDARILYKVISSPEGLDHTGELLIVGPVTMDNLFPISVEANPAEQIGVLMYGLSCHLGAIAHLLTATVKGLLTEGIQIYHF